MFIFFQLIIIIIKVTIIHKDINSFELNYAHISEKESVENLVYADVYFSRVPEAKLKVINQKESPTLYAKIDPHGKVDIQEDTTDDY